MANLNEPLPYYRWYWRDWRASRKVQRMTHVERGLYRELLDECWQRGAIPEDMSHLAEICDCPLDVMEAAWPKIKACLTVEDGMVWSERLESERTEADSVRVKRAHAGKLGGIAKASKDKHIVANASKGKQVPYSSSRAEQSSSSTLVTQAAELPTDTTTRPARSASEWKRLLEIGE